MLKMRSKCFKYTKFLISFLLMVFLMLSILPPAYGAVQKQKITRDIAIVFDNSGSMYGGVDTWCKATYAIEVFTAMMNDGDTVALFPMNAIKVDGKEYTSKNPLILTKVADAVKIQTMVTPGDNGFLTPVEPIDDAHDYLKKSTADEQWLVLTTDGDIFCKDGIDLSHEETMKILSEKLTAVCKDSNVVYLGIGVSELPTVNSKNYKAYATTSDNILSTLSEICNAIYGRDILPDSNISGNKISFDVPMSKLLIFVQGDGIDKVKLSGAGDPATTYKPHYSEYGAGGGSDNIYDSSLQGYIAIYEDLPSGEYELSYSGTGRQLDIYFEPNVDLVVEVTDSTGSKVDVSNGLYSDEYSVAYALVDSEGNVVTSPLLGNVTYTFDYSINGNDDSVVSNEPGVFNLSVDANDSVELKGVTVEFLSGYRLTKGAADIGWPELITVTPRPAGMLELTVEGGQDVYSLSELPEKGVYTAQVKHEGEVLSGADLEAIAWIIEPNGDNAPTYTVTVDGDKAIITLGYYNDDPLSTKCGYYDFSIIAQYTNIDGEVGTSNIFSKPFRLEEETKAFAIKTIVSQNYIMTSKIDEAEDIIVLMTMDGKTLTDEQLELTELKIDSDIEFTAKKAMGNSAIVLSLKKGQKVKDGVHKVIVTATSQNDVGEEVSDKDKFSLEFQFYPEWLRWAIIGLILAIIIVLLILILNAKVLPKRVSVPQGNTSFNVDGDKVSGTCRLSYSGKGKKTGSMSIRVPSYPDDSGVNGGFTLTTEAVSPRRMKSARRKIAVTAITATPSIQSCRIGATSFVRDENGKMVKAQLLGSPNANKKGKQTLCTFGNNAMFEISGETANDTSFSYSGNVKFH